MILKRRLLIFSGNNPRAVFAFIRTLDSEGLEYDIIAGGLTDPILKTNYSSKVLYIRETKALNQELFAKIRGIADARMPQTELFIVPSTEFLNRFILDNEKVLEKLGYIIPLVNNNLYRKVSDKESFQNMCAQSHIRTPRVMEIGQIDRFPVVAKPKLYVSSDGNIHTPIIIENSRELLDFKTKFITQDFDIQEYIEGGSYYLLYYIYKDGTVKKMSQQNLVQQSGGKSIIAAKVSNIETLPISAQFEDMFVSSGFYGLVMVEVKMQSDGDFCMIEANPRLWGPSQLFVDANFNLFIDMLIDNGLMKVNTARPSSPNDEAKYFWYGGYVETLKKHQDLKFYCKPTDITENIETWKSIDVYNRLDTQCIYETEVND